LNQMYYKNVNDPGFVELNVNLMNVQADEEDESESLSHSAEVEEDEENVETADEENVADDKENVADDKENVADKEANVEAEAEVEEEPVVTRTVNCPRRFLEELGTGTFDTLTLVEKQYFSQLDEIRCFSMGLVGTGVGGGFQDTTNYT
jgi:archaellum component FlaD/FlaE